MKRPYLIQRCRIKEFNPANKVSDYLELDYMGSAEFEFGAVPKCLRSFNDKMKTTSIIEYKGVYILGVADMLEQYKEELARLVKGETRLKEYASVVDILKGETPRSYHKDNFWIDLENDVAMCQTEQPLLNFKQAVYNSVRFMNSRKGQ